LLGTNEKSELDGSFDNVKCKLANEVESNVSFCAVNQFNIVARAGNNAVK
jgi:hypothetical protein